MNRPVLSALAILIVATLAGALTAPAHSQDVVLQSATLGQTGQFGGASISPTQFLGWRFQIASPIVVDRVGGHLSGQVPGGIFAAILTLPSLDALPTGAPFAPGEVVAATTLPTPPLPSEDIRTPLSVALAPGTYALLFGTNMFGATGQAAMVNFTPQDIPPTNIDSYIAWYDAGSGAPSMKWVDGLANNMHFVIEAHVVPEPTSHAVIAMALLAMTLLGRRLPRAA